MTTKNSPLHLLKAQSDRIAAIIKAAERGDPIDVRFAAKLAEARGKDSFKVAVAMDDKLITIDLPWTTIRSASEAGLSEYILNHMREASDAIN